MAKRTYTTAELAERMQCVPSTVTRKAKQMRLGKLVGGKMEFSADDRRRLESKIHSNPGNPQMKQEGGAKKLGRKGGKA